MIPSRRVRILADTSYAALLPQCDNLENEVRRRFGDKVARLARRFSTIRGILAWWLAREYDFVVTVNHWPGARWLIFLTAWLSGTRRRKIILLEFISCPERLINRLAFSVWMPLIFRPALRRVMVAAQVMCPAEPEYYSNLFGVPASLFHVIPLPLMTEGAQNRSYQASQKMVFASGRGTTDWETLFRAAEGANWDLFVVCSKYDRKLVDRLNKNGFAKVKSEIPVPEHAQIMASAAVYVMPLRERSISCGQLRMCNAISAGTPIVCTRVVGLTGYAIQNQTASIIEVGDHRALRREVDRLLSDLDWRRTLASRAKETACTRTAACFAGEIREFVDRVASDQQAGAKSA